MAKYKLDQWKELISEWQASGKTRQIFCTEKDVTVATFSYWRTKINKLDAAEGENRRNKIRLSDTACRRPSPAGTSSNGPKA